MRNQTLSAFCAIFSATAFAGPADLLIPAVARMIEVSGAYVFIPEKSEWTGVQKTGAKQCEDSLEKSQKSEIAIALIPAFTSCIENLGLSEKDARASIRGKVMDLAQLNIEAQNANKEFRQAMLANDLDPSNESHVNDAMKFAISRMSKTNQPEVAIKKVPTTPKERFDAEVEMIVNQVGAKQIGRTDGFKEIAAAARVYFPNDALAHTYYDSLVSYAEREDRKEISREESKRLFNARYERYQEALAARNLALKAEQDARDLEDARRNEFAQRQAIAAQQAADAARRAQATGMMLQGVGNAFRNAYGSGVVTCRSTSMPGVVTTNCQ